MLKTIRIPAGALVILVGPSGVGKSGALSTEGYDAIHEIEPGSSVRILRS